MATLNDSANRVLSEFGGKLPANLLQFEDARREFLQVRALEVQKLGLSDTNKTVTSRNLSITSRDGELPAVFGDIIPSFVEFTHQNNPDSIADRVAIIPVEKIPDYEGAYAIAFYGDPLRYRTAADFWQYGTMTLWYDPIDDLLNIAGDDPVRFAPAFSTFLVKKTAFNLCGIIQMNLAIDSTPDQDERMKLVFSAINSLQSGLGLQVAQWEKEFKKFLNAGSNQQPHLRRTNDEIQARGFNNITRSSPLDYVG